MLLFGHNCVGKEAAVSGRNIGKPGKSDVLSLPRENIVRMAVAATGTGSLSPPIALGVIRRVAVGSDANRGAIPCDEALGP